MTEPTASGMSLRDYLAAHAPINHGTVLQACKMEAVDLTDSATRAAFIEVWAALRYEYADAMLAARSPRDKGER